MSGLTSVIKKKIKKNGAISFCEYMEMCLYHPTLGYYNTQANKIGKNGDYFTSAYLGNALGVLIAKKMVEIWAMLGKGPFTIVEYGAGNGKLAEDILAAIQPNEEMYQDLRYCIIERSEAMKVLEKIRLKEKVEWLNDISEIEDIRGCVFSNEVLDNFPVHRVIMLEELMEIFVEEQDGFKEVLKPASPALIDYMRVLNIVLPEGYQTEINLEVIPWIKKIASAMKQGYIITIDYGDRNKGMYKKSRVEGTLCCYRAHAVNDDYYTHIGKQDITAHVNFSALSYWGQQYGLEDAAFTSQGEFLLQMGFNDWVMEAFSEEKDVALAAKKIALLRHALIMDMGYKFKVLIQEKGMEDHQVPLLT
ncbi:class I SAM-dependent methyltransferase [Pedobacter polysacchareus]|uniref:class I SAM-dependent methyltransferase n=1 Tax=Pedobacter polysacchareus TaxID=2861973 RepID=UPI001C9968B9|nr:SAM-dependent methyltransferase [Pedobacter polysacchareus]